MARFDDMRILLSALSTLLLVVACTKPPEYPDQPVITFKGLNKNAMRQGFADEDSLRITLGFTDGDGDLGGDNIQVFMRDTRLDTFAPSFALPRIPDQGRGNGISGEIYLNQLTTCCIFDNGQLPCTPSTTQPIDTFRYQIYIVDRAGNKSNIVSTSTIFLDCTK